MVKTIVPFLRIYRHIFFPSCKVFINVDVDNSKVSSAAISNSILSVISSYFKNFLLRTSGLIDCLTEIAETVAADLYKVNNLLLSFIQRQLCCIERTA